VQTIFFADVFLSYPSWLYLIFYSLPTLTWLFAALAVQIFTTKCLLVAYHLKRSSKVDPLKNKLQGTRVERATYLVTALITLVYLTAFLISWYQCDIGETNRIVIAVAYFCIGALTIGSSTFFLCVLKKKYGSIFAKERMQVSL
jgi:hydrogenase-4 membrane subunit HyfE